MALLTSCWFIIEAILIPEGLLKWFFLSFYIHPLLLFLCQIFLWAKLLQRWLLLFLSLAIQITLFVIPIIFRFFSSTITSFSFTRRSDAESVNKVEVPEIPGFRIQNQIADSYSSLNTVLTRNVGTKVYELRRLLRSLENDFELVYVAQSCLSWEALHYQYRKVEALVCASFQNGAFYENVVAKFQKFQILLERFMEDERCKGKRHWNYVQRRLSSKSLLQVPQVSGIFHKNMSFDML